MHIRQELVGECNMHDVVVLDTIDDVRRLDFERSDHLEVEYQHVSTAETEHKPYLGRAESVDST